MKIKDELYFRVMTIDDKEQVLEALKEFISSGSETHGIHGYEKAKDYEEFLNMQEAFRNRQFISYEQKEWAPSEMMLLIRKRDEKIVGFFNLIFVLTRNLDETFGGNLAYCIRPSERRKGYATEGIRLSLQKFKERGLRSVKIGCYAENIGSRKAIEYNCGKLIQKRENLIVDLYYEIQI